MAGARARPRKQRPRADGGGPQFFAECARGGHAGRVATTFVQSVYGDDGHGADRSEIAENVVYGRRSLPKSGFMAYSIEVPIIPYLNNYDKKGHISQPFMSNLGAGVLAQGKKTYPTRLFRAGEKLWIVGLFAKKRWRHVPALQRSLRCDSLLRRSEVFVRERLHSRRRTKC